MTRPHYLPAYGPDPYDPSLRPALDHAAFFVDLSPVGETVVRDGVVFSPYLVDPRSGPFLGDVEDTGLRCYCGREVVSDMESPTRWAHVGIGDRDDPTMDSVKLAEVS